MFFLALTYLAIPVFILLFSLFSTPFVIGAAIALAVLIFDCHRQLPTAHQTPMPPWSKCYPLVVITVLLVAIGVIEPYDHWDWEKSFGVFNLLRDAEFPPVFTRLDGESRLLRYYLGWYIVPSISSRFFGDLLLTPIMFLQTVFGITLALLMIFAHLKSKGAFLVATVVFFLFSGLDIVGALITGRECCADSDPYQWYVDWGVMVFPLVGTNMHPHHAIPTWIAVSMVLAERRLALHYGMLIGTFVLMWAPIVAIGLIPLYAWATIKEGVKVVFTSVNMIAAPLVALPTIFYLTQDTSDMPFSFIWEVSSFGELLLFWLVEFLLIALAIYQANRSCRQLLLLSSISLLFFTLFSYGVINDLIMRTSMPYIFILAVLASRSVIQSRGIPRYVLITYLLVGAIPAVMSLHYSMTSLSRSDKSVEFGKTGVVNDPKFQHQHSIPLGNQRVMLGIPLMRDVTN